MKELQNAYNL